MAASLFGMDLGVNLPNLSTAGVGFWITIILAGILILITIGIVVWLYYLHKIYNIQIKNLMRSVASAVFLPV